MQKIRKIKIQSFKSVTGKLVPISFNKTFPFTTKRIFFLHGSKNKIRGDHAHKKCSQLFMTVSGEVILNIKTPHSKKSILIKKNSKHAILVPPKYWCSVKFIKKNSILMVMTDRFYEYKDYIETFADYKKYLLKK